MKKAKKSLKKSRKKGIELSINFIVMIILILVIFTSSVYIVNKFFGQAQEMHAQLDEQTRQRINALLNERDTVVLPDSIRTVSIGDNVIFELGIWNIGVAGAGQETTFIINLTYDKSFDKNENEMMCGNNIPSNQPCGNFFYTAYFSPWTIKNTEKKADAILIRPEIITNQGGPKSGSHIFNVAVCATDNNGQMLGDQVCDGKDNGGPGSRKDELYDQRIHKITINIP